MRIAQHLASRPWIFDSPGDIGRGRSTRRIACPSRRCGLEGWPRMMWAVFAVFLAGYAAIKVFAVPEAARALDREYLTSTAIVVVTTAVVPFLLVRLATRRFHRTTRSVGVSLLAGAMLSVAGYATFWVAFIGPSADGPAMLEVARRGVVPGLIIGAIAAIGLSRARIG